ncbi:acyl-CoA dehydrogenase family protein, partial [Cribrihabitans sp. XS_ASV171]
MKLTPTEEQTMLADSVARFTANRTGDAVDAETWREIAGLGWLGAGVGEAAGGFGGGREMAIVIEQAGASALAELLIPNYLALAILEEAGPA